MVEIINTFKKIKIKNKIKFNREIKEIKIIF